MNSNSSERWPSITSTLQLAALVVVVAGCGGEIDGNSSGADALTGSTGVRRLTNFEYNSTVRDLLGTATTPADSFPADALVNGFDNNALALSVSPTLADFYQRSASQLADEITMNTSQSNTVLICDVNQSDCLAKIVAKLAKRAWRRSVSDSEVATLIANSKPADMSSVAPSDALKLAIRAILSSPHFIFRLELGQAANAQLNDYELASKLSYFLWSSLPDDQLMAAADAGKLSQASELTAQVTRMLNDPKADALVKNFATQWLGLRTLLTHQVDEGTYDKFDQNLRDSMIQESQMYFAEFLKTNQSMGDFLTAKFTFINGALADLYGITINGSDFQKVTLDGEQRGGFLKHASFLTLGSLSNRSSPIFRGKHALLDLLCVELPKPPANVPGLPAVAAGSNSIRDKLAVHRANPSCSGCHNLMDPIGLGLEQYDGIGGYIASADVDVSGMLDTGQSFTTSSELANVLSQDARFTRCIPEKLFRFANGRKPNESDNAVIDSLHDGFKAKGMGIKDLITDMVTHPSFRQGKGG